jgi:hypothetical protein
MALAGWLLAGYWLLLPPQMQQLGPLAWIGRALARPPRSCCCPEEQEEARRTTTKKRGANEQQEQQQYNMPILV